VDTFNIFELMKAKKYPFVFLLFLLTVFTYIGHGLHDYYDQVTDKIENTSSGKSAQGSIHQEPTQEDETHSIIPGNRYLIENTGCKRFIIPDYFIPQKLNFTIWLPPELS
jgi:hypothetical protein